MSTESDQVEETLLQIQRFAYDLSIVQRKAPTRGLADLCPKGRDLFESYANDPLCAVPGGFFDHIGLVGSLGGCETCQNGFIDHLDIVCR